MSFKELGERVFLSANTVADRVRNLLQKKIINGFTADLNLSGMDLKVQALIDVKLAASTSAADFESTIATITGVIEATLMTGSSDYMLKVACVDQEDLVRLIEELRERAGVQDTNSRMILRHLKIDAPLI